VSRVADTSLIFNIIARDKTKAVFSKMKGAALAAGAAIGISLGAGVTNALNKSKLDGVLAAQLGATPEQAAALGRVSGQVYAAGFGEDMAQVSAAIRSAAQNGLVDVERIADQTSQATVKRLLTVSTVLEEESSRVSAAVTTMLRTGMAGSADEAFDLIVAATQRGVNKSGDLIDTLEEYPTLFRSLGLNGQQSLGLIAQAMAAGARNADQVADGLKELSIRAIDGSKGAAEAYKLLGLDAEQMIAKIAKGGPSAAEGMDQILDRLRAMKDPVAQNTAGVGLLGTKWEDMRDAVLAMDLTTAAEQMAGAAGATDRAADSAVQKVEKLKRTVEMGLTNALAAAAPAIESTFGWLSRNSDWVMPLAIGLGVLAGVIYTVITATKIWTAVQTALNIVMTMNPIGLIVMAVLALIAVIVLIATKTTWFQTIWSTVWGAVKAAAQFVFDWIVGGWKFLIDTFLAGVKLWWSVFSGFWKKVGEIAAATWNWITDKISGFVDFVKSLPGRISKAARGMWDGIKNAFRSAINWLIGAWNGLSFGIPAIEIPFVGTVGGGQFRVPQIPYLAKGGVVQTAGLAVVGERGPELVSLTEGAQVTPLRSGGQAPVLEIRSGGSALDDLLVEILRGAIRKRGGNVQAVLGRSR